jgi:hypothetical protein
VSISEIASDVGKGLFAGLAGTAALTVSSTVEMKLRGRPASETPAKAAAKVLGVQPTGEREARRFANVVHWGYGSSWGAVRGLIRAAGIRGPRAAAAYLGLVWGTDLVALPSLDIGVPPPWEWGAAEVAIDAFHHVVYASTTSIVFERLDR